MKQTDHLQDVLFLGFVSKWATWLPPLMSHEFVAIAQVESPSQVQHPSGQDLAAGYVGHRAKWLEEMSKTDVSDETSI